MRAQRMASAALALSIGLAAGDALAAGKRVKLTGEIIDSFCAISGIMFGLGTAHHQCAVWCAVGGVPIGILGEDGKAYLILKVEGEDANLAPQTLVNIQTHKVTVDGELHVRDGVNYLLISQVLADEGIVNKTHAEHGIVPFGE
ncbi:MAG TPA: hypothetical protein VJ924_00835 [Alphaproteobacteria bacterium]|nr:hypothetical protein [Alphaproteobacteria bacterium]